MTTQLGNINLFVRDVERAAHFYVDVLGLIVDEQRSEPPGFVLLKAGTATVTLQDSTAPEAAFGRTENIELGFLTDDVGAIRERFVARNLPVEDIQQMGWGSGFNASDLDGHRLTVYRMNDWPEGDSAK